MGKLAKHLFILALLVIVAWPLDFALGFGLQLVLPSIGIYRRREIEVDIVEVASSMATPPLEGSPYLVHRLGGFVY